MITVDTRGADSRTNLPAGLLGPNGDHSLLVQFGDFYAELLRLKYTLASGGRLIAPAESGMPVDSAALVHQRLRILLENQAARTRHWGGAYGDVLYREAQYVMAALADETLLTRLDWEGRAVWQDRLLETALFGTRVAGERVFERIDAMLQDGANAHPDLATIYLVALSLGFRGRCWRPEDEGELASYRASLGRVVARHDPDLAREARHLFPDAYEHTARHGHPVRVPYLRPWLIALAAVAAVFLAVQHVVWITGTDTVVRTVERITRLGAGG